MEGPPQATEGYQKNLARLVSGRPAQMKILHTVESHLPARHGMSEVVRQISERLVARGHEVTVACGHDSNRTTDNIQEVKIRQFKIAGKSATSIWGDIYGYQQFILNSNHDIIVNFAAQQWATDLVFPLLEKKNAKKVFVPTGFSALADIRYRSYFENMRRWINLYDACVFLSDTYRDIKFARDRGYERIAVIPNGAAEEEFDSRPRADFREQHAIPKSDFLAIHIAGYLSVAKGQLEAVQIFSESHIENATMLIVCPEFASPIHERLRPKEFLKAGYHLIRGRGFKGLQLPLRLQLAVNSYAQRNVRFRRRIKLLALSRAETVEAFKAAQLLLFPSWIECSPLVLFEAAASKTPFLVTDVGNAREIISWTKGGKILPGMGLADREGSVCADIQGGAAALNSFYAADEERRAMADCAHSAWKQHFTWNKIAAQYESLYAELLDGQDIRGRFVAPPQAPVA